MGEARRNTAVLLAGGVGTRVGRDIPKQLIRVAGRPLMEHTLAVFDAHPDVDDIVVMMVQGRLEAVREMVRTGGYTKVRAVLEGAETRSATTVRALEALGSEDRKVLLHDAVRPLVTPRIIADCFAALDAHDAVDVAIASTDTIIEVGADGFLSGVPRRDRLRRGQTPQAFRLSVIRAAYARAAEDPRFEATDDCSVVARYSPEVPIRVVPGDERNLKVTEPIDIDLAERLFQLADRHDAPAPRDAASFRAALEGRTVVVFGASSGIGADVASLAEGFGANVSRFGRSTTGTHVERGGDVRRAAEETLAEHGTVDYVVNTAGVLLSGAVAEMSDDAIQSSTQVNYVGPVVIAREFFPHLRRTRGGLLLFSSSSHTRGRGGCALYSSAQAAVVNLTQALAEEWSAAGVRVNCVTPGRTGTPLRHQAVGDKPRDSLLASTAVALACLEALLSPGSGRVVDLRRIAPESGEDQPSARPGG